MNPNDLNYSNSLANGMQYNQPTGVVDPSIDFGNVLNVNKDIMANGLGTLGNSTQGGNSLAGGFFKSGNSFMDNTGQALGLAGGVASLADMLNNWGVAKKAMNTNMANVRQQMGQSRQAFDRSIERQDTTRDAISLANAKAKLIEQG